MIALLKRGRHDDTVGGSGQQVHSSPAICLRRAFPDSRCYLLYRILQTVNEHTVSHMTSSVFTLPHSVCFQASKEKRDYT